MSTNEENNSTSSDKNSSKASVARKHCLLLLDKDKFVRKRGFVELRAYLHNDNFNGDELREIFNETHIYILNGLRDKSELVREETIKFLNFLIIDKLPLNDYYLTYLFPVLVERIGTVELVEESEEIRLLLVKFLQTIIIKYSNTNQLKPFLNDMVTILCETVQDKYPEIKILSCQIVTNLAEALPRDLHDQSEALVKPVITCFKHQRSKVRLAAVRCLGDIVMHCNYKAIEEATSPLAERLFDSHPEVRVAVSQVTARWLLEYVDRYSFFHKLLPLILSGLNDEMPSTREVAYQLWHKVGLQYEKENENDLKDQMDFLTAIPKHYPEYLTRPNLGCRVLVQRNVSKIAPALMRELSSWQEDVTLRCSQLLVSVALHAETGITQHLQQILPAMAIAVRDDQKVTVENVIRAAEIIGFFVPPKTWLKLILPTIENSPHEGHLIILAAFIKGCPKENIFSYLQEIAKLLSEDYICRTRKKKMQKSLLKCVRIIAEKYKKPCARLDVEKHLFIIVVTLISLDVIEKDGLLEELRQAFDLDSCHQLWGPHLPSLLGRIDKDPKGWNVTTPERCIFETVLLESAEAFGENLDAIKRILVKALDVDADAESRLKTFTALSHTFDKKNVVFANVTNLSGFLETVITDVLVPTLVWHAGRTAEAMRTIAAVCLCSALTPTDDVVLFTSTKMFRPLFDQILPLLLSLAEDASSTSRQFALQNIVLLKQLAHKNNCWSLDDLLKIYPEIMKRLDDPNDNVRVASIKALTDVLTNSPSNFMKDTFKPHHELLIDALMIHFSDDHDRMFQDLVLDVLKVLARINRKLFEVKVNSRRPYFEKVAGCQDIVKFMEELEVN